MGLPAQLDHRETLERQVLRDQPERPASLGRQVIKEQWERQAAQDRQGLQVLQELKE